MCTWGDRQPPSLFTAAAVPAAGRTVSPTRPIVQPVFPSTSPTCSGVARKAPPPPPGATAPECGTFVEMRARVRRLSAAISSATAPASPRRRTTPELLCASGDGEQEKEDGGDDQGGSLEGVAVNDGGAAVAFPLPLFAAPSSERRPAGSSAAGSPARLGTKPPPPWPRGESQTSWGGGLGDWPAGDVSVRDRRFEKARGAGEILLPHR